MFLKCILALALSVGINHSFGQELFKVAPYMLRHTNGQLLLNMSLMTDKKLIIEDGEKVVVAREFKKDELYKIEMGSNACDVNKELRIKDAGTNDVIYSKSFQNTGCSSDNIAPDFACGFISDTQEFRVRHEAIAKVIAYHHALEPLQFLINGGDVVQDGQKDENQWIEYFKGGSAYLMDIPQIAAIGNHDYRGHSGPGIPNFFQKYMRWPGSSDTGNLFFDMPGFQLVIWNSNANDIADSVEREMWKWLEEKMQAAQKAKIPLIVATHFPVYSSSMNKFTSLSVIRLRMYLVPLAQKYGVKLILSGHTHMYERSFKDGVNYLVAGPAGGKSNKPSGKNPYVQKIDPFALTFTKIKYSNKTLLIETFNQENALIDKLLINL